MMQRKQNVTKREYYLKWKENFLAAMGKTEFSSEELANWVVMNNGYQAPLLNPVKLCAREIAGALREETFVDPQGRRVRRNYTVPTVNARGEQQLMWIDSSAAPKQMHRALQTSRDRILDDCRHLKTDTDSYNENNRYGASIHISFDFTNDLKELDAASE